MLDLILFKTKDLQVLHVSVLLIVTFCLNPLELRLANNLKEVYFKNFKNADYQYLMFMADPHRWLNFLSGIPPSSP